MSYHRTRAKISGDNEVDNIGVKKEIDKLGRTCIPKEMRKLFNLENEVELQITNEGILVKNPEYILVKKETEY